MWCKNQVRKRCADWLLTQEEGEKREKYSQAEMDEYDDDQALALTGDGPAASGCLLNT